MYQLDGFNLPVINLMTNEFCSISLSDVDQVIKDHKDNTIFAIAGDEYKLVTSLEDYYEHFFHLGLRLTDHSNIVNLNKVVFYDDKLKNVYFDESKRHFASVAAIQSKYIKRTVEGLKEGIALKQLDVEYLETETTKDKKFKKFLDFFARKIRNK